MLVIAARARAVNGDKDEIVGGDGSDIGDVVEGRNGDDVGG